MSTSRMIILTVLSTLTACAVLFASAALMIRASAAEIVVDTLADSMSDHHRGTGHGGMHGGDPCARLTDEHVQSHLAELRSRVTQELNLDSIQTASLDGLTAGLTTWADELQPLCELPLDTAAAKVSVAARFAEVTDRAMQRMTNDFDQFYANLDAAQQARLDDWFAHRHARAGGHS